VNVPWIIIDHGSAVKFNLAFCVVCVFTLQTGAFTIDSSNLNEHPLCIRSMEYTKHQILAQKMNRESI
jgi:hypothetical protein